MEKEGIKDSKLIELLSSLDEIEYKKFGLFIKSPFFNKSPKMQSLFLYFKAKWKQLGSSTITKEAIFKNVYGDKESFNEVNFRKIISEFTKLLEEFIRTHLCEQDLLAQKNLLLSFFRERKLTKNFDYTLKSARNISDGTFNKDIAFYRELVFLETEVFNYVTDNLGFDDSQYQKIVDTNTLGFILSTLELYYNLIKYKSSYNSKMSFEMDHINWVLGYTEKNLEYIKKDHPNIYAEYISVKTLLEPENVNYFHNLRNYVNQNEKDYTENELKKVYITLFNYCANRINKGKTEFRIELFEIIKELDEKNITVGFFTAFHLYVLSVVNTALFMKEFEWVEYFISKYEKFIVKDLRKSIVNISRANLCFHRKKYNDALRLLLETKYPNEFSYLISNAIELKIYFEQNEFEMIYTLYDKMKHFLKRKNHIADYTMVSYDKLLNYIMRLVKAVENEDSFEIEVLKKEIEIENVLNSKEWLLEKIEEREKPVKPALRR